MMSQAAVDGVLCLIQASKSMRDTNMAVNMEATMPSARVTANSEIARGAELVEHGGGEQGGEVGVEDGALGLAESGVDGAAHGEAAFYFLAYAFKDENVGVHGHALW